MKHSETTETLTQNQRQAANYIRDELLLLVELARTNHLSFIAYILEMAVHEASEIAGNSPGSGSTKDRPR